jgi:hypothetical protein
MAPVNTAPKKSHWWLAARPPATAEPTPAMAYWPSEICPVQPVRITSDTPMMA